jgi:hypothetical protein
LIDESGPLVKLVLLAAKSIGHISPAGGGVTAAHIMGVFEKLGIAAEVTPKVKLAAGGPNGRVSVLVSSGEAEIGLQLVSELMSNPPWRRVACRCGMAERTSRSTIRAPTMAKWRASRAKAVRQGNIEGNDVGWIAFLVALTDRRKRDQSGRGSLFDGGATPSPICVRGNILQARALLGYRLCGRIAIRRGLSAGCGDSWQARPR